MKINRLFEIVAILLNRDIVTAKELADRFQVSTRTIYRDIDVLSTAGVPVYTNKGSGGGISILDNYVINKTMLSEKDCQDLLITLKTLEAARYPNVDTVMNKLASLFKNIEVQDWMEADLSEWGSSEESREKFNKIKQAVLHSRSVSFNYFNSAGKKSTRTIDPLKLVFKGQSWYLWGYCRNKEDFRLFKINRMKQFVLTDEYFQRKEYSGRKNYNYSLDKGDTRETVNLKLQFSDQVLYALYDHFDDEDLIINNNTVELTFSFPVSEWIYNYILSFGNQVEVISPLWVREEVKRRIALMAEIYQ